MDFILGLLAMLFMVPLVTAHTAKQYGRSFWFWFALGCFIPIFSLLMLAILPDVKKKPEEAVIEQ